MKRQKKIISHRFLNRYTVLGAILLTVYGMLAAEGVFGGIFGGANLTITVLQLISSLCAGLFFGAVYLRSGSLWPTIVLHTLHDIVAFLFIPRGRASKTAGAPHR